VSQVVNGVLLPAVLIFMLILINDKGIMGEHVNSLWYNAISIILSVVLALLAAGSAALFLLRR
jgi:Mn2+/Fe2+ NRAMP family transporter